MRKSFNLFYKYKEVYIVLIIGSLIVRRKSKEIHFGYIFIHRM